MTRSAKSVRLAQRPVLICILRSVWAGIISLIPVIRSYGSRLRRVGVSWSAGSPIRKTNRLPTKRSISYALDNDHEWVVRTYGPIVVNPDDYYQENLVLSDLPAGKYRLWINYAENDYYGKFEIYPGMVTQIKFTGEKGFSIQNTKTCLYPNSGDGNSCSLTIRTHVL